MELLAILLTVLGLAAPPSPSHSEDPTANRVCFSKTGWSARDELRPCVRITRVYEDGSFDAKVENAGGDKRYEVSVGNRAG